ncbi:hypothetical protein GTY86_35575 [Streptomyces sp. SID5770]|uniref:hypothetical protein n=1 Tax=Streptomyces sp. SID5770 TaxID=2690308 RepID=UPI00136EF816|nr:hypothetical protein [Streptomyces sp. SID5770]MZE53814.1 hypothetical protein [Streptomyces sp. SID5770]MZE56497.1 hypothetical protein [Streptomyces sp. SID5770]
MTDWVTVVPGESGIQKTAIALLAVADDPADVQTRRGGTEFAVAPYVADRYNDEREPASRPRRRASKKEGE